MLWGCAEANAHELGKWVQAFARVENHYFKNKGFFPTDSFLLDNVDKIRHIRTVIVQVSQPTPQLRGQACKE
jgi:hypothetical protein